jgi:hypothetical protein
MKCRPEDGRRAGYPTNANLMRVGYGIVARDASGRRFNDPHPGARDRRVRCSPCPDSPSSRRTKERSPRPPRGPALKFWLCGILPHTSGFGQCRVMRETSIADRAIFAVLFDIVNAVACDGQKFAALRRGPGIDRSEPPASLASSVTFTQPLQTRGRGCPPDGTKAFAIMRLSGLKGPRVVKVGATLFDVGRVTASKSRVATPFAPCSRRRSGRAGPASSRWSHPWRCARPPRVPRCSGPLRPCSCNRRRSSPRWRRP